MLTHVGGCFHGSGSIEHERPFEKRWISLGADDQACFADEVGRAARCIKTRRILCANILYFSIIYVDCIMFLEVAMKWRQDRLAMCKLMTVRHQST
jgi:hypothetical protein